MERITTMYRQEFLAWHSCSLQVIHITLKKGYHAGTAMRAAIKTREKFWKRTGRVHVDRAISGIALSP